MEDGDSELALAIVPADGGAEFFKESAGIAVVARKDGEYDLVIERPGREGAHVSGRACADIEDFLTAALRDEVLVAQRDGQLEDILFLLSILDTDC